MIKYKFALPILLAGGSFVFGASRQKFIPSENNDTDSIRINVMYTPTIPKDQITQFPVCIDDKMLADIKHAIGETVTHNIKPEVIDIKSENYDVIYIYNNGTARIRRGGTRAWRNQNPGNIRLSDVARAAGAIGQAGGFAVFPNDSVGMAAIKTLLLSPGYRNRTIAGAVIKWAPPFENDTVSYKSQIKRLTGLSTAIKITELTPEQLNCVADAIRTIEGWRTGHEVVQDSTQLHPDIRQKYYEYLLAQQQRREDSHHRSL